MMINVTILPFVNNGNVSGRCINLLCLLAIAPLNPLLFHIYVACFNKYTVAPTKHCLDCNQELHTKKLETQDVIITTMFANL